jgi:SAM-dependent methyltransferase
VDLTLVYPRYRHSALEEQYATWQSEMLLREALEGSAFHPYELHQTLAEATATLKTTYCLVVTDPLVLTGERLASGLFRGLSHHADAVAAVPISNESGNPRQRQSPPEPYLTLRQFQDASRLLAQGPAEPEEATWNESDPGLYLCRTSFAQQADVTADVALKGQPVVIARDVYVHRWIALRSQNRLDLLRFISESATSVLEFGCGEALLGEGIKRRQRCRVVGIELDPDAAKAARKRIDDIFCGDVREIVPLIHERFEWIVGGDILEHLDEPWSFLTELRRISKPDGHLLLSIPNVANWAIVSDLLHGRFDYTYIGIACAGHLRFFTRRTIEETLRIAGWAVESITPQAPIVNSEFETLEQKLKGAGVEFSHDDLVAPGYYVIARNQVRKSAR